MRGIAVVVLVAGVAVLLRSCDSPERAAEADLTCEGLERRIVGADLTRAGLRDAFGPPAGRSVTLEPNRHLPDATDSIFDLRWDGLRVEIRTPPDGEDLAVHARISDDRFLRYPSVGMGAPADRVLEVLGTPSSRRDDALVYDCGMGASQPVTFHLEDGVVRRVEISFYVD